MLIHLFFESRQMGVSMNQNSLKKTILFICYFISINYSSKAQNESHENYDKVVFLTGAAGFIGSNFLKYMFDKYPTYKFLVLDLLTYAGNINNIPLNIRKSPRFEFWYGSVTNQGLVNMLMARSNFVVHFAAESHVTRSIFDNKTFIETDVMGTQVMMETLVRNNNVERFIHISTSEVYGTAEAEPMSEDHPLNPRSPYAAAKAGADRLVYAYCCTYDVPAVIVRPFNNFGPNQHLEKLIPRFITSLIKNEQLTIHGDGSAKRDWVYVLDVCKALDTILHMQDFNSIKHQVFNIGSGQAISVLEIAQMLLDYFQLPSTYLKFIGDRPGQVNCHISSTEKAATLLGWKAEHSLKDALPELVDWYKKNASWWENLELLQYVPVNTGSKIEMH